jgi:hypothetical protein
MQLTLKFTSTRRNANGGIISRAMSFWAYHGRMQMEIVADHYQPFPFFTMTLDQPSIMWTWRDK